MDADTYVRDALDNGSLTVAHIAALVRYWQQGHSLTVDGKPGPDTLGTLCPKVAGSTSLAGPLLGIDVSHHQGVIDWQAVAESAAPKVDFAWIKASTGVSAPDRQFAANARGAHAAGIRWGAYHWATPNANDPTGDAIAEANDFVGRVQAIGIPPDLPCALDLEQTQRPDANGKGGIIGIALAKWVRDWQDVVESCLGTRPIIYTGPWFIQQCLGAAGVDALKSERLWIADYTGDIGNTYGWKCQIHQFSSSGKVPGIKGRVDLDRLQSGVSL